MLSYLLLHTKTRQRAGKKRPLNGQKPTDIRRHLHTENKKLELATAAAATVAAVSVSRLQPSRVALPSTPYKKKSQELLLLPRYQQVCYCREGMPLSHEEKHSFAEGTILLPIAIMLSSPPQLLPPH